MQNRWQCTKKDGCSNSISAFSAIRIHHAQEEHYMAATSDDWRSVCFHSESTLSGASEAMGWAFRQRHPTFLSNRARCGWACSQGTPPAHETGWSRVEQTKITQRQQAINQALRPPGTKKWYLNSWTLHRPMSAAEPQHRPKYSEAPKKHSNYCNLSRSKQLLPFLAISPIRQHQKTNAAQLGGKFVTLN